MVSYVLLIVIAVGLSAGVYVWLKNYLPSNQKETCDQEIAIFINNYLCNSTEKTLTLYLKNQGNFNIQGFNIWASNETDKSKIPIIMLNSTASFPPGKYYFSPYLKPGETAAMPAKFSYSFSNNLSRIQIEPFINGTKSIILCPSGTIKLELAGCN
jgi:hypothetical protein